MYLYYLLEPFSTAVGADFVAHGGLCLAKCECSGLWFRRILDFNFKGWKKLYVTAILKKIGTNLWLRARLETLFANRWSEQAFSIVILETWHRELIDH